MSHSQETHAVSLRAISHIYAGGTPDKKATRYWENGSIPWVNSGTVNQGLVTRPSAFISEEAFENSSTSWARKGDLIVALAGQGQTKGKVAQMGMDACVNQSMAVIHIRETSNFVSRFAYYAIHSQYRDIRFMAGGDKREGLNLQHIGAIRIPYPPFGTQQRIADYLDRETAEIDAAVADLDKYVELMRSRLALFVADALEKSRHPAVPLYAVASIFAGDGITTEEIEESGTFPVYGGNGLRGFTEDFNQAQDRVLVGRQGALCGNVHLAKGPLFASEHALVVAPREGINLVWLEHSLRDLNLRLLSQASAQPGISASEVSRQRIYLPPPDIQHRIAQKIFDEVEKTNHIISESTQLRDLLLKRRSVLITEVVTGRKQV